jgi:hypothetical protein
LEVWLFFDIFLICCTHFTRPAPDPLKFAGWASYFKKPNWLT